MDERLQGRLRLAADLAAEGLPPNLARKVRENFERWLPYCHEDHHLVPLGVFGDADYVIKHRGSAAQRKEWLF